MSVLLGRNANPNVADSVGSHTSLRARHVVTMFPLGRAGTPLMVATKAPHTVCERQQNRR